MRGPPRAGTRSWPPRRCRSASAPGRPHRRNSCSPAAPPSSRSAAGRGRSQARLTGVGGQGGRLEGPLSRQPCRKDLLGRSTGIRCARTKPVFCSAASAGLTWWTTRPDAPRSEPHAPRSTEHDSTAPGAAGGAQVCTVVADVRSSRFIGSGPYELRGEAAKNVARSCNSFAPAPLGGRHRQRRRSLRRVRSSRHGSTFVKRPCRIPCDHLARIGRSGTGAVSPLASRGILLAGQRVSPHRATADGCLRLSSAPAWFGATSVTL